MKYIKRSIFRGVYASVCDNVWNEVYNSAKNIVNEDAWRSVHSSVSRAASNIDNINRNMGLFAEKEL